MNVNVDVNVLGSVVDLNIIYNIISNTYDVLNTKIKTTKSLQRYESAIKKTLILFKNNEIKALFDSIFTKEGLTDNCLTLLFLNASLNNDILNYFNKNVYFPAFFSGRIGIKKEEVVACIKELKESQDAVKKWSESTVNTMASKYLSLLTKFKMLEGNTTKTIIHKYIDDTKIIIYIYWLISIESKLNILKSEWLEYCFLESNVFKERVLQKKMMKYVNVTYTGDSMKIEAKIPYKDVYNELTKS